MVRTYKTIILWMSVIVTATFALVFLLRIGKLDYSLADTSRLGQFGDIIGGLVGTLLAGWSGWLLYLTLKAGRESQESEGTLKKIYELIHLTREQAEMVMKLDKSIYLENAEIKQKPYRDGRRGFKLVNAEFERIYNAHKLFFRAISVSFDIKSLISYAWEDIFWGFDHRGDKTERFAGLLKAFSGLDPKLITSDNINDIINHKVTKTESRTDIDETEKSVLLKLISAYDENLKSLWADSLAGYVDNPGKGFIPFLGSGFSTELSSYFRCLFAAVRYINELPSDKYTYVDKYNFVKMLRVLMNNEEQKMLFYGCIWSKGSSWEVEHKELFERNRDPEKRRELANKLLITKYQLIHNIPRNKVVCDYEVFYPEIVFDYYNSEEKTATEKMRNNLMLLWNK